MSVIYVLVRLPISYDDALENIFASIYGERVEEYLASLKKDKLSEEQRKVIDKFYSEQRRQFIQWVTDNPLSDAIDRDKWFKNRDHYDNELRKQLILDLNLPKEELDFMFQNYSLDTCEYEIQEIPAG